MKKYFLPFIFTLVTLPIFPQFSVEKYKEYLKSHENMTYQQLLDEFPAGKFLSSSPTDFSKAAYSGKVKDFLKLTQYEESLINKNGFTVTDRNSPYSFLAAYYYIYDHDLPVYISADAILHAMHYSFNKIYKRIEEDQFYYKLDTIIKKMHRITKDYAKLSTDSVYLKAIKDYDVYFTVASKLIWAPDYYNTTPPVIKPYFDENKQKVEELINLVNNCKAEEVKLFSSTKRFIDFSQFKPRGRYTESEKLTSYFKTMMWFGYVELLINDAVQHDPQYKQTEEDLRRQTLLSALIAKCAQKSEALPLINYVADAFNRLIGTPDNITINDFLDLFEKYNLNDVTIFTKKNWSEFLRYQVGQINSGKQLYNSQILMSDITNPDQIKPSTSFKLFGQIPVIDGFITWNVVYDNIINQNQKIFRPLPSTLDVLFALGNDASIQLLEGELDRFKYSSNLASLRYLISSYDTNVWNSSLYNSWLNAIKSLNPTESRKSLPQFMQTAAWWQKNMNTQLASWSQLRHDFILSVKQPYTAGVLCSFPYGFVEPVPELYNRIGRFFSILNKLIEVDEKSYILTIDFINSMEKLESIATKEINGEKFDKSDSAFINNMISLSGCVKTLDGWYIDLYYGLDYFQRTSGSDFPFDGTVDITVADVHTQPTDKEGNLVGRTMHAGTSYPNYSVVVWKNPDSLTCAYTGAVYSYFEQVTNNFNRLTDDEWKSNLIEGKPKHPSFCNLFLADSIGNSPQEFVSLFIEEPTSIDRIEIDVERISPNPATDFIDVQNPENRAIEIVNVFGQSVNLTPTLSPSGEGARIDVSGLAPGMYFVRIGAKVGKFLKI